MKYTDYAEWIHSRLDAIAEYKALLGRIYVCEFHEYMEDNDRPPHTGDRLTSYIAHNGCGICYDTETSIGSSSFISSPLDPSDISSRLKVYRKIRYDILLEDGIAL